MNTVAQQLPTQRRQQHHLCPQKQCKRVLLLNSISHFLSRVQKYSISTGQVCLTPKTPCLFLKAQASLITATQAKRAAYVLRGELKKGLAGSFLFWPAPGPRFSCQTGTHLCATGGTEAPEQWALNCLFTSRRWSTEGSRPVPRQTSSHPNEPCNTQPTAQSVHSLALSSSPGL